MDPSLAQTGSPGTAATGFDVLCQTPYIKGRKLPNQIPPTPYNGYSLRSACDRNYEELVNPGGQAFPAYLRPAQKMSVRLQFSGHRVFSRQVHILRVSKNAVELPSRGGLATVIAQEVQQFLNLEKVNGNALMYNGAEVTLDMLVLQEVLVVSRGSLQPVIAVRIE